MKKILLLIGLWLIIDNLQAQTITEITNILNTKPQLITTTNVTANNTNLFSVDLSTAGYRSIGIQLIGTWSATITFQGSNNNFTDFGSIAVYIPGLPNTSWGTTAQINETYIIPTLGYRYIRARTTSFSSGTISSIAYGFLNNNSYPTPSVSVINNPVLGTGGQTIGKVAVLMDGVSGTQFGSIGHGNNGTGTGFVATGLLAEFDDVSPTAITENQFGNLRMSSNRNLFNTLRDAAGNERGANVNASNELLVAVSSIPSHAITNAGTFPVQENGSALTALQLIDNLPVTLGSTTSGQSGALGLGAVTTGAPSYTTAQTNALSLTTTGGLRIDLAGSAANTTAGLFSVKFDQTIVGTTNAISLAQIGATTVVTGGVAGTLAIGGNVATNTAIGTNPINLGAQGVSSENAAVTTGRMVQLVADLNGKLITIPYANPENFVSGAITTAMTGTTTTSLISAPASGLRNYITTIVVSNAHATVGTDIIIQDGSGGTTLMTIPAAAVYGGAVINLPVPLRQPTTATAIFCANITTGASTKVSAVGYIGK